MCEVTRQIERTPKLAAMLLEVRETLRRLRQEIERQDKEDGRGATRARPA